jgi:hypothetical protein
VDDHGHAISFKVLRRGTPVISADGVQLGTVRRVEEAARENIFDGIVVDTSEGQRFLDAPEVHRIAERAVTVTLVAAEAEQHLVVPQSRASKMLGRSTLVRRAKRAGEGARERWDRR